MNIFKDFVLDFIQICLILTMLENGYFSRYFYIGAIFLFFQDSTNRSQSSGICKCENKYLIDKNVMETAFYFLYEFVCVLAICPVHGLCNFIKHCMAVKLISIT